MWLDCGRYELFSECLGGKRLVKASVGKERLCSEGQNQRLCAATSRSLTGNYFHLLAQSDASERQTNPQKVNTGIPVFSLNNGLKCPH